jgi:hypothetical protein
VTEGRQHLGSIVGPAMRQSHDRAKAAGCTLAEMRVLFAVHYWLGTYSKLDDRVSLGQLAVTAGMWTGATKELPHAIRKRVSERLRALEAAGALIYTPGGRGHGVVSSIAVPSVEDVPGVHPGPPNIGVHPGPPNGDLGGSAVSTRGSTPGPHGGAPRTPHPVIPESSRARGADTERSTLASERAKYVARLALLESGPDREFYLERIAEIDHQIAQEAAA